MKMSSNESGEIDVAYVILAGGPLAVICFLTIAGNLLVILAVSLTNNLRGATHLLILNLAVADLLLGLFVLPFSSTLEILKEWIFGRVFCELWLSIDVLCCTGSIMSLCAISVDRYIGVTQPLKHASIVTEHRCYGAIIGIWTLSVAISITPYFGWRSVQEEQNCKVNNNFGYALFSATGSFYLPALIIMFVYWKIYRAAIRQTYFLRVGEKSASKESQLTMRVHVISPKREEPPDGFTGNNSIKSRQNRLRKMSSTDISKSHLRVGGNGVISDHGSGSRSPGFKGNLKARFKDQKKAAKTLGIVVGVFMICWSPFFVLLPLTTTCEDCIPELLFKILFWLGYCNSTMNPFIYAVSSTRFRVAFETLIRCRNIKKSHQLQQRQVAIRNANLCRANSNYYSRRQSTYQAAKPHSSSSHNSGTCDKMNEKPGYQSTTNLLPPEKKRSNSRAQLLNSFREIRRSLSRRSSMYRRDSAVIPTCSNGDSVIMGKKYNYIHPRREFNRSRNGNRPSIFLEVSPLANGNGTKYRKSDQTGIENTVPQVRANRPLHYSLMLQARHSKLIDESETAKSLPPDTPVLEKLLVATEMIREISYIDEDTKSNWSSGYI